MTHAHPHPRLPYSRRGHAAPDLFAPALAADRLTAGYPGAARPAADGVTFAVPRGAAVALVGPNGAGKSTVLKAAAGLLPVRAGAVRVFGNPVGACHHRTAYLPQRGEIDWRFPVTVGDLVLTGRYVHLGWLRRPGAADRDAAHRALDRLGIAGLAGRPIAALSGGQQQRALVARALAQGADLLLLDEPFNHLDAETRADLGRVFGVLRAAGKTLVVATHDAGPGFAFDAVLPLAGGRLVQEPEPAGVGG